MKSNAPTGTVGVAGGIGGVATTTAVSRWLVVVVVSSALWTANTVVRADDYGLPTGTSFMECYMYSVLHSRSTTVLGLDLYDKCQSNQIN